MGNKGKKNISRKNNISRQKKQKQPAPHVKHAIRTASDNKGLQGLN